MVQGHRLLSWCGTCRPSKACLLCGTCPRIRRPLLKSVVGTLRSCASPWWLPSFYTQGIYFILPLINNRSFIHSEILLILSASKKVLLHNFWSDGCSYFKAPWRNRIPQTSIRESTAVHRLSPEVHRGSKSGNKSRARWLRIFLHENKRLESSEHPRHSVGLIAWRLPVRMTAHAGGSNDSTYAKRNDTSFVRPISICYKKVTLQRPSGFHEEKKASSQIW